MNQVVGTMNSVEKYAFEFEKKNEMLWSFFTFSVRRSFGSF